MKQKHNSTPDKIIFTNSLIKVQLPELPSPSSKFVIKWSKQYKQKCDPNMRVIFRGQPLVKDDAFEYHCTPLDYGAVIKAKVMGQDTGNSTIVKEFQFGPVVLQDQISKFYEKAQRDQVNIVINKNMLMPGQLKVSTCPFVLNNNYKASAVIKADQFEFQIRMEKDIKMPPNSPFFKFYPNQQNSLGISIFHQHSQLMEKLRLINVSVHSGYYLKFYFRNREFRDVFLIQLMQYFGLIPTDENMDSSTVFRTNILPELERAVYGSYISKGMDEKERGKEIDDEIFKLLYDRESQLQNEQRRVSFSFQNAAQFLLSSIRKSGIQKISNMSSIRETNYGDNQPKQKDRNRVKQKRNHDNLQSNLNIPKIMQHFEKRPENMSKEKQKNVYLSPKLQPRLYFKNQQNSEKENELRSTITKLTNQIEDLIKENRRLSQENKKLKDQNMKWRYKEIKKTFKQTINQKINHEERRKTAKQIIRPNTLSQIPQPQKPSPVKVSSSKYLKPAEKGSSQKRLLGSRGSNKTKTIESPGSNGTSQPSIIFHERKRNDVNFTSCISVSNKQFIREPTQKRRRHFIPRKSKLSELNKSGHSRRSRNPNQNSFQKPEETPSTPFFTNVHSPEVFGMKVHESQFFRKYMAE